MAEELRHRDPTYPVRHILHTILEEERLHRGHAEPDLVVLETRA